MNFDITDTLITFFTHKNSYNSQSSSLQSTYDAVDGEMGTTSGHVLVDVGLQTMATRSSNDSVGQPRVEAVIGGTSAIVLRLRVDLDGKWVTKSACLSKYGTSLGGKGVPTLSILLFFFGVVLQSDAKDDCFLLTMVREQNEQSHGLTSGMYLGFFGISLGLQVGVFDPLPLVSTLLSVMLCLSFILVETLFLLS